MDHQVVHSPGGRKADEGKDSTHEMGMAESLRRERRQHSRRIGSEGYGEPGASASLDELDLSQSFVDLRASSISSIPTGSSSWDTNSDGEERVARRTRPDRRKFIDTTTPTLIDEEDILDDEEEEMVSLAHEQLRREMTKQDERSVRRTPGASMYSSITDSSASMRRTPGASAMHSSSRHTSVSTTEVTDSALLGFGLALSTPVAPRGNSNQEATAVQLSMDSFSSSSSSFSRVDAEQADRPPRAPNSTVRANEVRDSRSYTPAGWTLSKNPHLEVGHGAFSPNTLRLTEDLDNLLHDEEDNASERANQHVFRDQGKGDSPPSMQQPSTSAIDEIEADEQLVESWTAPYIFGNDGGSAEDAKATRSAKNRKAKNEGGRRSRGGEGTRDSVGRPGTNRTPSELRHAHPKPLRQEQVAKIDSKFAMSSLAARIESPTMHQGHMVDDDEGPRPLNFGGAFVPPPKGNVGNFRRPVPSSLRSASYDASVGGNRSTSQSERQAFASSGTIELGPGGGYPQMNMNAGQQMYGDFRPPVPVQTMNAPQFVPQFSVGSNDSGFHSQPPPMNYGNPMFGASAGPSMGFQGMNPYAMETPQMGQPMGQQIGQGYMPMQGQQPPPQHFAQPQSWSQMMPANYNSGMNQRDTGWHSGSANRGWGNAGDFGYGLPTPGMMDARMHLTPSPQFTQWQDPGWGSTDMSQYPSQQANPLGIGGASPGNSPYHDFSAGPMTSGAPSVRNTEMEGRAELQHAKSKKEGKDERGLLSRKQRNANKKGTDKQRNTSRDKGKGRDAQRKKGASSPNKKKQSKARETAQANAKRDTFADEGVRSLSEDAVDTKRAEIEESPAARAAYKEFYREFRAKERISFKEAESFAKQTLERSTLPEILHWRVQLELADLAKRSNRIVEARNLYKQVCELQPYASQGWLEYSKLEEECGHLNRCANILENGLEYCEYSESLLTRAIKHAEKMGKLDIARQLLARLKHVGIEKVWRTVLEGAMLEARAGNGLMARRVLKYLMHHVPWYGPLYLEAYRLERDRGRLDDALAIVEQGLTSIPRYGPLWFGAFRLCEALDRSEKAFHLPRTSAMLMRATQNISRELVWKIHLDAAQILERAAIQACSENASLVLDDQLKLCRQRFALTAATCPPNLCWKVWLASGRMELSAGNPDRARALFLRAQNVVPDKGRAAALLECSRLEEFVGNPELARAILARSRFEVNSDWKVWLESVLLEVRSGHHHRAIILARRALETHSGTGRLWACLVQLRHYDGGEEAQFSSLKRALRAVPKSGEVWCEGGRIHLNPFSNTFDLTEARRHLFFATRFTPQYGDSFLETMKLELLEQWIAPIALNMWQVLQPHFLKRISDCPASDEIDNVVADVVVSAARQVLLALNSDETTSPGDEVSDAEIQLHSSLRKDLTVESCRATLDNSELERRCANADPNYGLLWFHCRNGPIDTARTVITCGRDVMIGEIISLAHIYIAANVRRFALITTLRHQNQMEPSKVGGEQTAPTEIDEHGLDELEALLDSRLRAASSLEKMLQPGERDEKSGMVLLESSVSGSDFVTGLVELNKHKPLEDLPLNLRRRALFGSDALFS